MQYWLALTTSAYSLERVQIQEKKTVNWDSELNEETAAYLQTMRARDRVLLLDVEAGVITGELQVSKAPFPDPRQDDPHSKYYRLAGEDRPFFLVPLKFSRKFTPVPWAPLMASQDPKLAGLPDVTFARRQTIFPLKEEHHRVVTMLARTPAAEAEALGQPGAANSSHVQRERVEAPVITDNDLILGEELGTGQFGKVYRAKFRHQPVAVKILNVRPTDLSNAELESVKMEVDVLQNMHCPHITKFFGAKITSESIAIVTELLPKGELGKMLLDESIPLDMFMQLRMAWDVARGMNWLHSSKPVQFLHRDLKPSNLLVDANYRIKICDFGFCVRFAPISFAFDSSLGYRK